MRKITTSLIISTYNRPEALEPVLLSVKEQTLLPTEVIIADDGSKEPTKTLIEQFKKAFPVPLIHVWHEDKGFRLAEIRNKAIKEATGEYIIQIDGDVILHKKFIKDHISFAKKGYFVTGSRVLLKKEYSNKFVLSNRFKKPHFFSNVSNRFNLLYFPKFNVIYKIFKTKPEELTYGIRGCNMSFWREDLIAVNGYNCNMKGWGREDSEIGVRLINYGIVCRKIKFVAIQYHLYHKEHTREGFNVNEQILNESITAKTVKTTNGITELQLFSK